MGQKGNIHKQYCSAPGAENWREGGRRSSHALDISEESMTSKVIEGHI